MRRRLRLYQGLMVAAALCAGGCSLDGVALKSPSAPSPNEVATYMNDMRAVREAVKGMTPREYLTASIVYSNQRCREFFIALAESQREERLYEKVLNAANAAGTSLFPVWGGAHVTRNQAVFTASMTGALAANDAVREVYGFGAYANELSNKVTESQNAFLSATSTRTSIKIISDFSNKELADELKLSGNGTTYTPMPSVEFVINIGSVTRDESMLLARYLGQGYAYQCSVANMSSLVRSSIASARIGDSQDGRRGGLSQAVPVVQRPDQRTDSGDSDGGKGSGNGSGGGNGKVDPKPDKPVKPNKPDKPDKPTVTNGLTPVENAISLADGAKIQQNMCLSTADGNFGGPDSATRDAIRLYQVATGQKSTGLITEARDRDRLVGLKTCIGTPYQNVYERLVLSSPEQIAQFHGELVLALRNLRDNVAKAKSGEKLTIDLPLLTDTFAKQNFLNTQSRDAIRLIERSFKGPESGQYTPMTKNVIKDYAHPSTF